MNNEILVQKAQKGDENAFYSLMLLHKEQLYRIGFAYFSNEQDSLEAIQEVTYRAFKNIRKIKEPQYFSTWLIRIMINYCNNELRKKKRIFVRSAVGNHAQFAEHWSGIEIRNAVDKLDEKCKQVVILKYFQGFKIYEIAKILNRPEGTIKTWLNKGLNDLRKELDVIGRDIHD